MVGASNDCEVRIGDEHRHSSEEGRGGGRIHRTPARFGAAAQRTARAPRRGGVIKSFVERDVSRTLPRALSNFPRPGMERALRRPALNLPAQLAIARSCPKLKHPCGCLLSNLER